VREGVRREGGVKERKACEEGEGTRRGIEKQQGGMKNKRCGVSKELLCVNPSMYCAENCTRGYATGILQ